MLLILATISCLIFSILFYYFSIQKYYSNRFKNIKYTLPFLGNALYLGNPKELLPTVLKCHEKYGDTFGGFFGTAYFVFTINPKHFRSILTSKNAIDKSWIYKYAESALRHGLILENGSKWGNHRRLLDPVFTTKNFSSYVSIFNEEADRILDDCEKMIGKEDFCFEDISAVHVLNASIRTMAGHTFNEELQKCNQYTKDFKMLTGTMSQRCYNIWLQVGLIFKLSKIYKIYSKCLKSTDEFVNDIVVKYILERKMEPEYSNTIPDQSYIPESEETSNLFGTLANLRNAEKFTTEDVVNNAHTFLKAGYETISGAINYAIFCLAANPRCQENMINEIHRIFPNQESIQNISYEDTKEMIYTGMVINETLRLFPILPVIARELSEDLDLDEKITLCKGTQCILNIFALHRDKKLWGDDAEKFHPERFSSELADSYQFLPFSKGPRICIGWKFAYVLMKIVLAKVFFHYKFTTEMSLDELKFLINITLVSVEPLKVQIHKI